VVLSTAPVRTDRLTLPLWTAADVAAIRRRDRRPDWHRDFPREDDVAASSHWVAGDAWGPRSIVRGTTVLGSIGFFGPPEEVPELGDGVAEAEVGYGLVAEAHGWGFATEALQGLLRHTDEAGVRVRAGVLPENGRSLRVLAKCGFTQLRGATDHGELIMVRAPMPVDEDVRDKMDA
jgi:[ribosomal protein S5]-alanine N-acetyltransferase